MYETRCDAYLVERWLKCGSTRKKRAAILSSLSTQGLTFASKATLVAAQQWQRGVVHTNSLGTEERG